jgi:hypothetical protein
MRLAEFTTLVDSGLLGTVERLVVEDHRRLWRARGQEWSAPVAYQWLRYESPDPVASLLFGVERLSQLAAASKTDNWLAGEIDAAERLAAGLGYSDARRP